MNRIVLASQSPRRRELLARICPEFDVIPSGAAEEMDTTDVRRAVEHLALKKAEFVALEEKDAVVIGADTIVVQDGKILGKPVDEDDAFRMIRSLSGRVHEVYTGCAVVLPGGTAEAFSEETKVHVAPMTDGEIRDYIATGEPMDKAGAYGIQGAFAPFIVGIEGDYYNVVGLPLCRLYHVLREIGEKE